MLNKIKKYCLDFLEFQTFITTFSLPIIIYWGLPVSYFIIIGNLIFTPLLTCFLAASYISFCLEFFNANNKYFIICIEAITKIWLKLLSYGKPIWLTGFSKKSFFPAFIICIALYYALNKYKFSQKIRIILLFIIILIIKLISIFTTKNFIQKLNNKPFFLSRINNKNYCLDFGTFNKKLNHYSWINFNFIPNLINQTGELKVDTLFCYKSNKDSDLIIKDFINLTNTKKVFATNKNNLASKLKNIHFKNSKSVKIFQLK